MHGVKLSPTPLPWLGTNKPHESYMVAVYKLQARHTGRQWVSWAGHMGVCGCAESTRNTHRSANGWQMLMVLAVEFTKNVCGNQAKG